MEITDPGHAGSATAGKCKCPGGNESGGERHGRLEEVAATESIEPSRGITLKLPTIWRTEVCPRREWSRGDASDIDEAQRASAWVMRESIEPCVREWRTIKFAPILRGTNALVQCPRREYGRREPSRIDEAP